METIADYYNIENARPHIAAYTIAVDDICEKFKHRVLENENLMLIPSSAFKYESIQFILEWQRTDDLTLNDIDGFLKKAFGDMANKIFFKYGLKRKLTKNGNMFRNLQNLPKCVVHAY